MNSNETPPETARKSTGSVEKKAGSASEHVAALEAVPAVSRPAQPVHGDAVELALATALERASAAGEWAVVTTLAAQLDARRLARAAVPRDPPADIVDLDSRRKR